MKRLTLVGNGDHHSGWTRTQRQDRRKLQQLAAGNAFESAVVHVAGDEIGLSASEVYTIHGAARSDILMVRGQGDLVALSLNLDVGTPSTPRQCWSYTCQYRKHCRAKAVVFVI